MQCMAIKGALHIGLNDSLFTICRIPNMAATNGAEVASEAETCTVDVR